jgi:hypothetical protein
MPALRTSLVLVTLLLVLTAWPASAAPSRGRSTDPIPAGEPRPAGELRLPQAEPQGAALDGQTSPAAIPDGTGGMIVTWEETRGGVTDVYLEGLDGGGNPRWPTVAVCTAGGYQRLPTIVTDGAGGAIVTWYDNRGGDYDIYAQRVLASGVVDPAWPADGRALCTASGSQHSSTIASDGAGGAIVTWEDYRTGDYDIYAQRVLASGAADPAWPADGRALCTAANNQVSPTIACDGAGGAIVTWVDLRSGNNDIYAQRVLAGGAVDPAWPADGRALCTASGTQQYPTIASDGAGGAIVTWYDARGGLSDIYAQRVLAGGAVDPAWPADGRAVCTAASDQVFPNIVADDAGGALITWYDGRSGNNDIYAQRVLASGAVDPAWPANGRALCIASGDQRSPEIVPDGAGGAFVTWSDYRSGAPDIYAQRVLASGAMDPAWPADGRALCTATGAQQNPTIVPDGRGGAIVAWEDARDGNPLLHATRVTATGTEQIAWPADGVDVSAASGEQYSPKVVPDGAGGVFVTWSDLRGGDYDIYAQRLLASGAADPAWPADGLALCTAAGDQRLPALVLDGTGGVIVTWYDDRSGGADVYAQRVLASGVVDPAWPADGCALCTATGEQLRPEIVPDGAGGAIVTWNDYRGAAADIYAQRVLASGVVDPAWPANGRALCTATSVQTIPAIAPDGVGGAIVTWHDYRFGLTADIYAQRVLPSGAVDPAWPPNGRAVCSATGDQRTAVIVSDGAGGAILTWQDGRSGVYDIYAQRVLASGAVDPAWPADGRALCTAAGDQFSPAMVTDGAGGAFVTWHDRRSGSFKVYAQRVLSSGALDPGWPADGRALCTATGQQYSPTLAPDGAGGAFVTWHDSRAGNYKIFAQRVLANGALDPAWPAAGLALCTTSGQQYSPMIAPDGAGGGFVTWEDSRSGTSEIIVQRIARAGPVAVLWTPDGVTSALLSLVSAVAAPGAVRLVWHTEQTALEATLDRSEESGGWISLATLVPDDSGRLRYVDEAVTAGRRYGYRLRVRSGSAEIVLGEVWLMVPSGATLGLEGLRPNPARRDPVVAFSLAEAGDATLELLDLAGRRVIARRLTGLPAGNHVLSLDADRPLAAGVYLLRLTQAGHSVTRKAVVAR